MQSASSRGIHLIRLDRGEEVIPSITGYCRERGIRSATVQGIGALQGVEIGAYVLDTRSYVKATLEGDWELLGLQGNVTILDGAPFLHAHVVLGDAGGMVRGGHLFGGRVAVTAEIAITETGMDVVRRPDEAVGLNLWCLEE